jgi:cleavage and polyadenylation specificity factor subunit 3
MPPQRNPAVIVESTYGVSRHLAREVREKRFLDKVVATLLRGGRVLLPIVALGRAQVGAAGRPQAVLASCRGCR